MEKSEPATAACTKIGESKAQKAISEIKAGERIEVFWRIAHEDEGQPSRTEERWWGATVKTIGHDTGRSVLVYDEYNEFAPVEASVTFLGPSSLRDEESGGDVMHWKREGCAEVDDVDGEEDDEETQADDLARDVYSMDDVLRAQDEVDAEEGVKAGEVMLAALQSLPTVQQTEMAFKYREFADELKSQLASLMARQGPGYVVTAEDIQAMFTRIRESDVGASDRSLHQV